MEAKAAQVGSQTGWVVSAASGTWLCTRGWESQRSRPSGGRGSFRGLGAL